MRIHPTDDDDALKAITSVLVDALRVLGESGRPETANRLADGCGRRCATAIPPKPSASTR